MLLLGGVVLASVAAVSQVAAAWEQAGEFRGWASYSVRVDARHETAEQVITLKKTSHVNIHVNGSDFDGAYYHPRGMMSGTITTHMVMSSKKDGGSVDSRFSGRISEELGRGKKGGFNLSIHREKGLYTISLPSGYATGTAKMTVTNFGTTTDSDAKDEIHPMVPQAYQDGGGGNAYDKRSGVISGSYTDTVEFPLPGLAMPAQIKGSWNLRLGKPDYKVVITDPAQGEKCVYWNKELSVMATATADPKTHDPDIAPWYMEPIDGVELEVDPSVGPIGRFVFRNYPEENLQFGVKAITADNSEPVTVRVFFPMWSDGDFCRNNPEGKDPDWFYYWKQGPVPFMEDFEFDGSIDYCGSFSPPVNVYLGKMAGMKEEAEVYRIRTSNGARTFSFPATEPIDTCARTVVHELKHRELYDAYKNASPDATDLKWLDTDGDLLPDWLEQALEPVYGFDHHNADTHRLFGKEYRSYGDQELLCRLAELGARGDHASDWSYPGTQ